jgi:hypothetical protein
MISMQDVSNYVSGGLDLFTLLLILFFLLALIGIALYLYMQNKRYSEFFCVIWSNDAFGNSLQEYDQAGIFVDRKTNCKRFFMKKNNIGLTPDKIPVVITTKGRKYVYLVKTGHKNFTFIKPVIKFNMGDPRNLDNVHLQIGEEDVNWAINAYERQKKVFGQDSWLQYLPFISLIVVSFMIMLIFIYFFKKLDVIASIGASLDNAASTMASIYNGTTMVGITP